MVKLIYLAISSLDGYIADGQGKFDWCVPDPEVHGFVNELERPIGTYLYGRRLYEVMMDWQNVPLHGDQPPFVHDFARLWQAADKVVYSRSLRAVSTPRTRLESHFDVRAIERLKASADRDLSVGGAELAAHALRAELVDECHLLISPVIIGAGKLALPSELRLKLELLSTRRFANGVVHVHYRTLR